MKAKIKNNDGSTDAKTSAAHQLAAIKSSAAKTVDVPSILQCAADTLDEFQCADADYYRAEFAKIEHERGELFSVISELLQISGNAPGTMAAHIRVNARKVLAQARGGKS